MPALPSARHEKFAQAIASGTCTAALVPCAAADIVRIENGRLAEHWDVLQDEATKAESKSGLPMFGDRFTT
jgi:predicted SnoaL-like aldol condensation-catalyzing enzyme